MVDDRQTLEKLLAERGIDRASSELLQEIVDSSDDPQATVTRVVTHFLDTETGSPPFVEAADEPTRGFPVSDGEEAPSHETLTLREPAPPLDDTRQEDGRFGPWTLEERLVPTGTLGAGGMGAVYRTMDLSLGRRLALKVLRTESADEQGLRALFLEEAQVTAQLAHPSIPPVHELGLTEDRRPFFTMKEVQGRTLLDVLVERNADPEGSGWTPFRLLEIFQRICEATAYAHARGVVHCDIKPSNVMVGPFGEVTVMDWGVALLVAPAGDADLDEPLVETPRGRRQVRDFVAGTPAYMPPEQAAGDHKLLGPASDVYALGVMLFEIVCGRRPYEGHFAHIFWASVRGDVPDPIPAGGGAVDESLREIIERALQPDPTGRFPHAGELAREIAAWREGARQREKALEVLGEAHEILAGVASERERADVLRARADKALAELDSDADVARKEPAWALQDEALVLVRQASLRSVEAAQLAQAALVHAPDLAQARTMLARIHYDQHRDAVARRDWNDAAQHEIRLQAHDTGEFQDYLAGTAPLSLDSEPPSRVRLYRFETQGRQLVPDFERDLGRTPLVDVELPVGSYLLELVAQGRPPLRVPVVLRRREGWDGIPPGASAAPPVRIPAADTLDDDEVYVPGGWFDFGGDPDAAGSVASRRTWLGPFVIRRTPVTAREFAVFLAHADGAPWRHRVLRDGLDIWHPDWPVVGVSREMATAYARWLSERSGKAWRLPCELEWEKAARGVDGRLYPWGDHVDAAFCHARSPDRVPSSPVAVGSVTADRSPYGLADAAGNVREWCACSYLASGPEGDCRGDQAPSHACRQRGMPVIRGGSWRQPLQMSRVTARSRAPRDRGYQDVGFRLVHAPTDDLWTE